jgi:virulence factor Mce-like protein
LRRLLAIALLLTAAATVAFTGAGAGGETPSKPKFTVELDNAFGIVNGADLKVAGVRAGKITGMRLDRRTKRALVDFKVTQDGFGSLRSDVFCEVRPQGLIGEYFIDCDPGKSRRPLKSGAVIPVEHTASTIPVDLINDVMRRPERERLPIIINELGAAVAGRSTDLNDAIRRAVPALRETDRVLVKLGDQNQVLKQLTTDADAVVGDLADNRKDVGRWVSETRDAASASAERREDIRAGLQRLPTFLAELKPTMAELGKTADAQVPALTDLNASAGQLNRLFTDLPSFAEASRKNLRSLADASKPGRRAVKAAQPSVAELDRGTQKLPELASNATFVLKDLDDRSRATEKDPRSPGGQGYTGFESVLQYMFDQAMAINIYDANGFILKINAFVSKCSDYQNPESLKEKLKEDKDFLKDCFAGLGPNQPGITTPDPTYTGARARKEDDHKTASSRKRDKGDDKPNLPGTGSQPPSGGGDDPTGDLPAPGDLPPLPNTPQVPQVPGVPELPGVPEIPDTPNLPQVPDAVPTPPALGDQESDGLLDYLFGP